MLRSFLFAISIAALSTTVSAKETAPLPSKAITIATSYTLASRAFGDDREINVRLPASYEKAKEKRKYPVLYVVDGAVSQDFEHIAGLAHHGEISGTFDEFIVVGVQTKKRIYELTFPADDERYTKYQKPNGGSDKFRDLLTKEVMPWVNAKYRTNGHDAIIGESLAGLFIMETFLKYPKMFDSYISISPSLWWDKESLGAETPALLAKHDQIARKLYITMANEGGTMQRGLDAVLATLKSKMPKGLSWTYVDRRDSEFHGSIYHLAALDALRTLYGKPHRTGVPSDATWLFTGDVPGLSEMAKENVKKPCNHDNAVKVSYAEIDKDPAKWRGMCVLAN